MNKNCYRIVFSHVKNMFIAVAEIVKSRTKTAGQSQQPHTDLVAQANTTITYKKLQPINFAVMSVIGAVVYMMPLHSIANTQIIADKSAPSSQQATVLTSGNGTTQVNIQTPSAGGVSRNTYTQFDVGQEGVILNNSRNNTQTQLGGWVEGNPWLATGEAKIILNEVNSSNPSQLRGYIEVAGKSAQVVIANPSGLVCDGCGVINADRFTLTTGQAVMNQGYLESFRVRDGQITIEGKGLDGSLTPYTDIYSRALTINAGLYAKNLTVALGQNDITVKDQVTPQINTATSNLNPNPAATSFALDVGQLGGMYAGKIFLVGNENGLGVRNAGSINSTESTLTLNANGDLINTGNMIANKDQLQINAQHIQNTGNISSATSQVSLNSQTLDNSGLISSADELHLQQQGNLTNTGTLNAARIAIDSDSLNNQGSIEQTGTQALDLNAGELSNQGGQIGLISNTSGSGTGGNTGSSGTTQPVSTNNSAQDGGSVAVVDNTSTVPKTYAAGYIHVKQRLNNDQGVITTNGSVNLISQNGMNNENGQLQLGTVTVQGGTFNNQQGQFTAQQADIQTQSLNNQSGQMNIAQKLNINSQGVDNTQGKIQAVDQIDLAVANLLDNSAGQIASGQFLTIHAGDLNNQSGLLYSELQSIDLTSQQNIANQSGTIQAKTSINLSSQNLNNDAGIIVADSLNLQHQQVSNQQGNISAQQSIQIQSQGLIDNQQGQILADQSVVLNSQGLNNNQGIIASLDDQVSLNSGQAQLSNQAGLIQAKTQLTLESQHEIDNQQGLMVADLGIHLTSQGLNNNAGQISSAQGDILLNAGNAAFSNQAGQVLAGQNLQIVANRLDNSSAGQLAAQSNLQIETTQDINNQSGNIAANQSVNLNSLGINNQQGQIGSIYGSLSIEAGQAQVDNQQGRLQAGQQLNLSAAGINNSQGQIIATDLLTLNSHEQTLNNLQGILSGKQLLLDTGELNNDQGLMQAQDGIQLNTHQRNLINSNSGQQGGILSQGTIQLQNIATLNNQDGYIASGQQLLLDVNQLLNNRGTLLGADQLQITGTGLNQYLDNQSGQILSMGDMTLSLDHISNQGKTQSSDPDSQIVAAGQLNITTQQLDNQNTLNDNLTTTAQGIDAQSLNIESNILNNQQGSIRSRGDQQLLIGQQLNNQQGQISSQQLLQVQGDQLQINNLEGQLLAGTQLDLQAKSLSGDGRLLSLGNATLTLQDDYLHATNAQLQANQNLTLNVAATLVNNGVINAGNQLQLNANNISNLQNGKIESHETQITAQDQLTNTGLINGDVTWLQANTVTNQGTGRIYGTDLAIAAKTLNNTPDDQGNAPVIASRGDLHLGVETLNNLANRVDYSSQALIFSAANLYLGGTLDADHHAIGQANVINNESATIESLGDMQLSAQQMNNINKHFITGEVEVARTDGLEKFYWSWYNFDGTVLRPMNGREDWSKYQYSEITYETQTLESAPAKIIAGGNLDLSGANVLNDKSQILAGDELKNEGGTITSLDAKGIRKVVDQGTQTLYWKYEGTWVNPFQISTETTIDLPVSQLLGGQTLTQQEASTTKVSNNQSNETIKDSWLAQATAASLKTTSNTTTTEQAQTTDSSHLNTTGDVTLEVRTVNNSSVKVPNSALYRVNPNSQAGYLIETDPNFTNYGKWLSSDYMLNALGLDPALQQKRLGDGFYEQRMLQDQIANLTGYRFLDGYASDEAQYKALMDNGLTFAETYGLRPGVALSATQIAQLTSDIVWLVEKTVTLPDGTVTQALVPQVYIKARVGDLKGDGTLLSANSVNFQLNGDLLNSATIAGREAVQITADNVNNLMGRIQGNTVAIATRNDLNNIGGQISAQDAMALNVGGNLNLTTTTKTATSQIGGFSSTVTGIDRVAGLYVGNGSPSAINLNTATLVMDVAGNAIFKGAEIQNNNGATVLNAKGNIDIGTVQTGYQLQTVRDAKNSSTSQQTQDVGSQITSAESLLLSGQNIDVQGSALNSEQGTTYLSAADQLNIGEGRKTSQLDSQWYSKKSGILSSKTESGYIHNQSDEAIASTVEGKNVVLDAKNITIQGSQVVADNLTQIQATENVNILAAENHESKVSESYKKKSGFTSSFSDGVASVGYAKSKSELNEKETALTITQSQIHSQNGSINISAGKDLTMQAALLNAGEDINLTGQNVNLNAAYATTEQHSKITTKQTGLSIGVTYSGGEAAKSAYEKSNQDGQFSDSVVGQVMAHGEAVRKASMAAATPVVVTAGSQKTEKTSDIVSTQAVVTEVAAKGNLNIIADQGSIQSQGAKISAEGDALLHAKNNILLDAVQDTHTETANSKRSGFSTDNRDWLSPLGIYNDKNIGDGQVVKTTGTQLSVGGSSTLQTEQGDIKIIGSSVVAQNDNTINAGHDVYITSSQQVQSQNEVQSSKGWGSAQISDTERFDGYMNSNSLNKSNSVEQQRSQIGSLAGNINIQAGNQYTQQVADLMAAQDINIRAKDIAILEGKNTGSSEQSSQDLKIGLFSRVSSPLIDLANAIEEAKESKADDRTKALQGLAAVAQGYQSYSDLQGAYVAKAEAGIGFKTSQSEQKSTYASSQQNLLNAGGNINLTSTEGNIHLQNTQVTAKDTISLDSAKDILLESGQSQQKADGKNSNAGLSVGYGASFGAQTGVYFYAEAGYGQGSNHTDNNIHSNTTLKSDQLQIKSQGDATLAGAQASANRIDADIGGKLSVISQQDTVQQDIDQTGVGARLQISLGTAWQVSGNYSNSNASGNSNSVHQQSGLFAGEGGYHVKADSVDLKGGAIVSTAAKENNDLTANSLAFSNIQNSSSYDATTVSLSGGFGSTKEKKDDKANTPTSDAKWRDSQSFSPSLPQYESDNDSSTTYATLSAGNITIGGKTTTVEELGIHSDIATANRQLETLPNLQEILDKQKTVAAATSTIVAATRTYSQNQAEDAAKERDKLKEKALADMQAEGGTDWETYQNLTTDAAKQDFLIKKDADYADAYKNAQAWGIGGDKSRALNAVTTAITGALGGQTDLQVVTNTLAPYGSQLIGESFGHGEDKNTAAQLTAHAILGATLAYINGGDPLAGGSAAVASEAAATYFANQYNDGHTAINPLTGEFDPNLLPENVKTGIRDLTAGIGAVIGGAVGDSSYNAQLAGVIGQNAVENNELLKVNDKGEYILCIEIFNLSCAPRQGERVATDQEKLDAAINLAIDFIPGPEGKGVKAIVKATGELIGTYKDAKAARKAADNFCSGSACFTAGTLIETDQGLKAVEEFVGGELVWARNDLTLEYGYRPVIATKVTADQPIFHVTVQNEQGQIDVLETTAEHPFWIKDLGWLKASLLQSGMTLLDRDNQEITIVSQALIPNRLETVYNIEVEGFHTYHVGELGVWVHNANCCNIDAKQFNGKMLGADGVQTFSTTVWKGNGKSRIDVENPSPGNRPGQLHYQDNAGNKYYYDPNTKVFFNQKTNELAPKAVQNLLTDSSFSNGIDKALKYLGVKK